VKKIALPILLAVGAIAAPVSVDTAYAQATCGWMAPPSTPRLPADVETIIAQLPANWKEAPEAIANLNKWFHDCDDPAGHEAIFAMQRALRRGIKGEALNALLGTTLMHGPEVQIDHATGITNRPTYQLSNAERDGARLLAHAARTDPMLVVAAGQLAEVALSSRHAPTVKIALETLRDVMQRAPSGPYATLAAELALVSKDYKQARTYGEEAVALGDSAAYHAIAVASVLAGEDSAGEAAYMRGVSAPGAIDLYYDDISFLLQPDDTLAWQQLADEAKPDWIRKQWKFRAATSGQSVGERLKVHFERLAYAIEHYPRTAYRTPPGTNAVMMDQRARMMTLDDRGLIYVRHGAPDEIIAVHSANAADATRQAWGYKGLFQGRALFEFTHQDCPETLVNAPPPASGTRAAGRRTPVAANNRTTDRASLGCRQSSDYYLASPLGCTARGNPTVTYFDYGAAIAPYSPGLAAYNMNCFSDLTGQGGLSEDFKLQEAVHRSTAIIQGGVAMRTESAAPPFTRPLDVAFMTYAMRDGHDTQVFGFAGVSGAGVKPKANTTDYALRVQLSVENNRTLNADIIDTTLASRMQAPLQAGQVVRASVATKALPANDATVRMTVRNQNDVGQGQVITAARAIPDFSTDKLALSDLVIAEPRDGSWNRGGVRLAPIPAHLVQTASTFRLFYELYGVHSGDSLDVQIIVAPGADASVLSKLKSLVDQKSALQVGFTERATADDSGTSRVVRDIPATVEPGRYVVTVRIRDSRTNETATAHTELIVVKQ
jgi:GWxTD domain-containing protein